MSDRRRVIRRGTVAALGLVVLLTAAAAVIWRDDILRTALDPKVPFQTYRPPPPPDYARRSGWLLLPNRPDAPPPALVADVFFVAPTAYDGGAQWNAPVHEAGAERFFRRSVAPNYVGPFLRTGRIFAPRYRQASLYTQLTLREDAREARRYAYGDVARAFRAWRERFGQDRPFVLVGVEQGGTLAARLLAEEIAPDPSERRRLVAAYLVETVVPAGAGPIPPCMRRRQSGCLAAWAADVRGDADRAGDLLERALVWGAEGQLENLAGRPPLCFNPLLGAVSDAPASLRLNLGAANATGLEWGARPAFQARQVSARCDHGVLRVSRPRSQLLRPAGSWADRRKVAGYNLFWADLEADAKIRLAAWRTDVVLPEPLQPASAEPAPILSLRPSAPVPPASRTAPAAR